MCKSKMSTSATEPTPSPTPRRTTTRKNSSVPSPTARRTTTRNNSSQNPRTPPTSSSAAVPRSPTSPLPYNPPTSSGDYTSTSASASSYRLDSSTATTSILSGRTSLSSLRDSLPANPHIYDFSEIRSATNNFLSKRISSSSPSWRCTLRNQDVVVFQRKLHYKIETSELKLKLFTICRSHHMSIIKLLGISISGNHIYLVYDYIHGANLEECLRNPRNPNFTVLSTWMSRIQIATDLAHGLDYIHNNTGLSINFVHKHVKSSSVIVTEPSFNAKICHFGAAELCGESVAERKGGEVLQTGDSGEIVEEMPELSPNLRISEMSPEFRFEGVRGYMSPEFKATGVATQKSDVYAFGIVLLELLSGEEPVRYKFDKTLGDYRKICIMETANDVINGEGDGDSRQGRLRRWVDRRLKDSFPVEVVEKMTRVALDCVHEDPVKRPGMRRVAGKISKLYLESRIWSDQVWLPTDFSVSLAPR